MLVRKTVTVLFSDVVTSTALGERLDPESLRRIMSRYFDEMNLIVERHGGTVEKFIGDEVMAVFGVPVVHEDDALRAVRAAAEMRDRLAELNDELESTWGVRLEARTGINTGQVVAGDPAAGGTFVTGEPVVLAKRLEQAAGPGEILIGKATYPLVRDAVKAGPLESFSVKGKAQPVARRRLDEVDAGAPGFARRLDARLVGRQPELALLREAFDLAVRENACRLLTVLGPAGIGKSRLAAELCATIDDRATWLTGRCLAYGEGITFWPLAQIVREAGGDSAIEAALEGSEDAETVAELVRGTIGRTAVPAGSEETFWAVRRLLEAFAARRPLVLCLEDIHWAEPTLLDLIEYLAGWIRDAPVLLLCLARPDLLERQPSWANPRSNALLVPLEPLSSEESDALLDALQSDVALSAPMRERIAAASEGNPLFVEQMVAMAEEDGAPGGTLAIPPSIQALLAERLDRLDAEERAVVERASVIGKEFPRRALVDLCPPELQESLGRHLMALVRKELIRPDLSAAVRGDGFRFRHVLIRDAAYDAMPKEVRAGLHQRFAAWMETQPWAAEVDEIVGYHLEQAFRHREQLGPLSPADHEFAARAARLLGSAGRVALGRGDARASAKLLQRAVALLPEHERERRLEGLLDLATALRESGELARATEIVEETVASAAAAGDERLEARARVERTFLQLHTDPHRAAAEVASIEDGAVRALERASDDFGLARAWTLVVVFDYIACRIDEMERVLERALVHADRAGVERLLSTLLMASARGALVGPTAVEDAIERCESIVASRPTDRTLEAVVLGVLAPLEAMRGQFGEARDLYGRSIGMLADLGRISLAGAARTYSAAVELLAGDAVAAERELRTACDELEAIGDTGNLATVTAILAEALRLQGRQDEAASFTVRSEETSFAGDVMSQVAWRSTRAKLRAAQGAIDDARELARDAVALADATDHRNMQGDALIALGDVLHAAGDAGGAAAAVRAALERYEAKGNVVSAAEARARLERAAVEA